MAGVLDVDGTLAARSSLGFEDLAFLDAKPAGTRLGFAAQLAIYRMAGRFARAASEFADAAIAYLVEQVGAAAADLADWDCPVLVDGLRTWELRLARDGLLFGFVGHGRAVAQA